MWSKVRRGVQSPTVGYVINDGKYHSVLKIQSLGYVERAFIQELRGLKNDLLNLGSIAGGSQGEIDAVARWTNTER